MSVKEVWTCDHRARGAEVVVVDIHRPSVRRPLVAFFSLLDPAKDLDPPDDDVAS